MNSARLFAVALLVAGCQSPSSPSTLTEGVVVYADPNFRGQSNRFTADVFDLDDMKGGCIELGGLGVLIKDDWDDCISSIRIAPGWSATVYEDPGFRGLSMTITSDVADLETVLGPCGNDWDDCVSSIRVSRP
jgi:hypothetical protein